MTRKVGIIVGGGPAPGINGVIGSATIEAINRGCEVVGILDGFKHLAAGGVSQVESLKIEDVSRIHTHGGSILRTSRTNPTKDAQSMRNVLNGLAALGIEHLVTIGGDDTATTAVKLHEASGGKVNVVHVPKTIDNDLPLPSGMPTFGFETARELGAALVGNLMEDSRTTQRWFIVVAMGRSAGHLALGIARAAGATLAVIPEEFPSMVSVRHVCDIIEGAMIKRRAAGKDDGVAVVAEGVAEKLRADGLQGLDEARTDEHGHLRLAELGFAEFMKRRIEQSLKERGMSIPISDKNIGYELRCAAPIAFDLEYTRTLGHAAVKFLLESGPNVMVALSEGKVVPIPFGAMVDPQTGRTRLRLVDVESESYEVALRYMIRLRKSDFESTEEVRRLASAAKMTEEAFRSRFQPVAA
ncbi:MAG: 6-phosphofructokinase [Nitrospirae bacterium]|nr:6-phosphofructokinase [Nitrospirota bacterium]